jgi:hypothetical protein
VGNLTKQVHTVDVITAKNEFICGLFVSSSDSIASNDRMIINNVLGRIRKEVVMF